MNLLSVEKLYRNMSEKILFEDISFGVESGERIAMVARNGAGKTTLLKILQGKETADRGKVVFRNNLKVSFLEQDPVFPAQCSAYDALFRSDNALHRVVSAYEKALALHEADPSDKNSTLLESALNEMESANAWDYEARVKQVLSHLKLLQLDQPAASLSGGEQKRLALARVLLEEPELLIMDEPTNHLDLEMIEWLEEYFRRNDVSLLVVTHDRYFLDNVCTAILELDRGQLYRYDGNYEYFIQKKAERESNEASARAKAENLYRRELEWIRKSPRARTTKSRSRINAFGELEERLAEYKEEEELALSVKMTRIGGKILELKSVTKAFGDKKVLAGFDHVFKKGERIGIVGKNGVGKTTLLNLITGSETPDTGTVSVGETITFGYYSQKGMVLKEEKRVIEVVKDVADHIPMADGSSLTASQLLQHFLFSPEMQYTFVSKLSGGEKKRLYLLTVLMKNPNFLILDEPTNDLDLATLSTLENFLSDYNGCLMIVSHDRYFMDKLCDTLFIMEGEGRITHFNGTYSEWRAREKKEERTTPVLEKEKRAVPATKKGLSYKEKFEMETLEKEMPVLEQKRKELEVRLGSGITDHAELQKLSAEIGKISEALDRQQLRWLELADRTA
ncbi:MAG: ABC-F family ATP-binding cassette domain-containing protein [Bacteroidia bacterium]|nr:ABC-F family ATP-binding cassette domain-containing protein [Bacteroidia bacterium]